MFGFLIDYLLCRSRVKTMKEKLDDAEKAITEPKEVAAAGTGLPRTLSIRIPRTASCERCFDVHVVSPPEADSPEWHCLSCVVGGSGRPRCPRPSPSRHGGCLHAAPTLDG